MKKVFIFLVPLLLIGCQKQMKVVSVSEEIIPIDSTLDAIQDSAYLTELQPIREQLNKELDVVIGYAAQDMLVFQPECPMLNWASDALLAKARQYYSGRVDMAVVNVGGMRCEWQKGPLTLRSVYELMPFDNELVVLTLQGADILDLCQVFAMDGGQGVAGMRMNAEDKQLIDARIDGKPIEPEAYYMVATSDYLSGGADHMTPLIHYAEIWRSSLLIRDLYLDYIRENDTIIAMVDGRMNVY